MRSTNPQILKNQILRCVTQSESTRVDRDRNPGSNPGWCKKKGGALDVVETLQMKWKLIQAHSITFYYFARARELDADPYSIDIMWSRCSTVVSASAL